MKIILPFCALFLFSCGNPEAERLKIELEKVKKESKLTKDDSLRIYDKVSENKDIQRAERLLDSIKLKDPVLLDNIKKLTSIWSGLKKYESEEDSF